MNNFEHENPGQSIFQGSDLASIQVNNNFQDDNEDHLDVQRLDQELKIELDEVFNESGANMSVISSSHCSDASGEELESNESHPESIHKTKRKKASILSNPAFQHLQHYMNTNFQPDFHRDGSYPSPIPQYNPQVKSDKHITSNDAAHNVSKQYVYEGMSNEANYETLQALYEMRRSEVNRLEKELSEFKMQAEAEIDNLRKNLLINESEGQRTVVEYQRQCENLKENIEHLENQNLTLKLNVETKDTINSKLTKELETIQINMKTLEEQLTNLSRNNGSRQYDTNVDCIVNDLKKKHKQEVVNLQNQYKSVIEQIRFKDRHCTLLTNELKKLQQEHHRIISENNDLICNLKKELNAAQQNKLSISNNYDHILNLNSQLIECSKQNQQLNNTLQRLTVENEKLHTNLNGSHVSNDLHNINDGSLLEEDYQKSLELLQKQRDDVKNLTEMLSVKNRSIAELEKKEITYQHCIRKIQLELEKYSRDKSQIGEHSNYCETLRNALELQLEDTMCKLIRTEEMATLSKQMIDDKLINNNSIEEYMHYHQLSLENISKQKDEEIEKLKNRMEEYVKEIDELKQLYVKVCSEKEHSLNEKERLEKRFDELSSQFETLDKQYGTIVKEKEELAITLTGIKKEMSADQDSFQKQSLIKEIEDLKNELLVHKRQKEMIAKLKIDLIQSKERVLSLEQRLQSECDSKVATYFEQLENLKKQYEEKVDELKQAKDIICKLTNSDLQTSSKVNNDEKTLRSKLSDYENSLSNIERKHKLAMNEMTFKYKNELDELEMIYNKKFNEEKVACGKIIEELKSKHKIEIETLNTVAKQNADDYVNQEMIQIVAHHKQQFEKAREIVTLKNNLIKELEIKLENAKTEISNQALQYEQFKEMHSSSTNMNKLKQQIEEERSKFAQIMTNWSQEMRQMKDKLSTTVSEWEKLQAKYAKVKHAALGYKHANQKQHQVYNELLVNCVRFLDELKTKTDELLTHRENEIQQALEEFENDCKQRRLAFSNVNKLSSFNTS
ncbi:putative leucine-rich repeat-containing protein DDB_G0290503 isoform X1 [Metopolophium dirhodum]|uniref:putative leucine-rich repeat-containing protein DDB_G0290503 isoform X1 n=1 Tax=Metopolophium dirhodum TaxID=44670 RepID=UPI0029900129|nr:putative leucine-rich repeat-containing protein DDB_G0290503 isoform X1 [Metopolophium dirhodum]